MGGSIVILNEEFEDQILLWMENTRVTESKRETSDCEFIILLRSNDKGASCSLRLYQNSQVTVMIDGNELVSVSNAYEILSGEEKTTIEKVWNESEKTEVVPVTDALQALLDAMGNDAAIIIEDGTYSAVINSGKEVPWWSDGVEYDYSTELRYESYYLGESAETVCLFTTTIYYYNEKGELVDSELKDGHRFIDYITGEQVAGLFE